MVTSTSRANEVMGSEETKPRVKALQTVKNGCQYLTTFCQPTRLVGLEDFVGDVH